MRDKVIYTWRDAAKIARKAKKRYNKNISRTDIKAFKKKYGFRYSDTWEMDTSLACWLLPRIAHLRDHYTGIPNSLCILDENMNVTNETEASDNWFNILNTIVNGLANKLAYLESCLGYDKEKVLNEQAKTAMELVAKHYLDLWD